AHDKVGTEGGCVSQPDWPAVTVRLDNTSN
ncbi:hypothetical protein Tco_0403140, partial [Tanacetum coccineum]